MSEKKVIPTWHECHDIFAIYEDVDDLNSMEQFVYDFEPTKNTEEFRKDLQAFSDKYNLYF